MNTAKQEIENFKDFLHRNYDNLCQQDDSFIDQIATIAETFHDNSLLTIIDDIKNHRENLSDL